MVASGGTKVMAMAVPGRASFKSGFTRAKAVVAPAMMAINRYTIDGLVKKSIWEVTMYSFPPLVQSSQVRMNDIPTLKRIDFNNT